VNEVFEITNNRIKVIKIIALAKSAIRNNLGEELSQVQQPTCLIWGNNDTITPPFVGKEFQPADSEQRTAFHRPVRARPDDGSSGRNSTGSWMASCAKLKSPAATV
jgi:2-hydroxy-6-oxonona-2,4-dienedioate hydrolase